MSSRGEPGLDGEMNQTFANALRQGNQITKGIKAAIFLSLIFLSLFGNSLVIISICKFKRMRKVRTNFFLLSLAVTDFLVAFLVMPFKAILVLTEDYWPFPQWVCTLFNSNDVLLCTASIIHLCCIAVDRYIAVFSPLSYDFKMTRIKIASMLLFCWTASFVISYLPIWTHIHEKSGVKSPIVESTCDFEVNELYAIMSSTVSFWIPSIVMTTMYIRIYRQANRQKQKIISLTPSSQFPVNIVSKPVKREFYTNGVPGQKQLLLENWEEKRQLWREPSVELLKARPKRPNFSKKSPTTWELEWHHETTPKQENLKIDRENKAAKTLGIIMGAFILCWLPFFLWYTITFLCGEEICQHPKILVEILFWIGYSNSTLNPIIYVLLNREFRAAFFKLLGFKTFQKNKKKCIYSDYVQTLTTREHRSPNEDQS